MSRNQEIKFVKYWEENVKEEYKNERHNFFTYDWWFEKLPKDLKEIILKIDNSSSEDDNWFNSLPKELRELILKIDDSSWEDNNYEHYLEELESEIKSYLRKYKHWNYNDEEIQYLFEFSDFCQAEDDESETDIVKEKEY